MQSGGPAALAAPGRWRPAKRGPLAVLALAALLLAPLCGPLCGCRATTDAAPPAAAAAAEALDLVRAAADHEGLFTLAGGLKPMSTGIWQGSFAVEAPDLAELRAARAALAPLRNDLWYADVQVFDDVHEGERAMHAFVVHRAALARMVERFEPFWSPWGITPCTHPAEVVAVVDRMPRVDRWRAYGYLFGYPADAIEFFLAAGLAAEREGDVGPGKDRRFVHIPTYAAETGRFTYAVPLESAPSAGDEALASEAARILAAYAESAERPRTVGATVAELRRLNRRFERAASVAAELRDASGGRAEPAAQGAEPVGGPRR